MLRSATLTWEAPTERWIKLNSDEAISLHQSNAAIGGVIRDYNGQWLWGYSMSFGKETVFKVEAQAMLEGLLLAWDKLYHKIEVKCDNELLIEILLSGGGAHSDLSELRLLHLFLQRK